MKDFSRATPLHTHSQLEINLRPILDCCTKTCLISLTSFSAYKFIPLKCTAAAFALERVFANSSLAKKTLHFLELPISSHRSLPCLICLVSGQQSSSFLPFSLSLFFLSLKQLDQLVLGGNQIVDLVLRPGRCFLVWYLARSPESYAYSEPPPQIKGSKNFKIQDWDNNSFNYK